MLRLGSILVAHGGLSGLGSGGGLFRRAPIDQVFRVHLWHVARADIPSGDEERQQWLLDCWQRVDGWVAADEAAGDPRAVHTLEEPIRLVGGPTGTP